MEEENRGSLLPHSQRECLPAQEDPESQGHSGQGLEPALAGAVIP